LSNTRLQYWQRYWPQRRLPEGEVEGGGSGWMPLDDWFNGVWKDTDTKMIVEGNSVIYSFNPINAKEFPEEDLDVVYRRSLKIRLLFKDKRPDIQNIEVYSNSMLKEAEVKIEWGNDIAEENWQGYFEIYNGELEDYDTHIMIFLIEH
jgi:hypothetical protein